MSNWYYKCSREIPLNDLAPRGGALSKEEFLYYYEHMLEQLFGSRTRVKLLRIFLSNPETAFYVRELVRKTGEQINSIRRELSNLEDLGLINSQTKNLRRFYKAQENFVLYPELRSLLLKARLTIERQFLKDLKNLGTIQYLALLGYFVDDREAPVDIFVVGRISKTKLRKLLERFNRSFGEELRYTVIDHSEFKYRHDVTDKFLFDILNRKKIVVINKINI